MYARVVVQPHGVVLVDCRCLWCLYVKAGRGQGAEGMGQRAWGRGQRAKGFSWSLVPIPIGMGRVIYTKYRLAKVCIVFSAGNSSRICCWANTPSMHDQISRASVLAPLILSFFSSMRKCSIKKRLMSSIS